MLYKINGSRMKDFDKLKDFENDIILLLNRFMNKNTSFLFHFKRICSVTFKPVFMNRYFA